MPKQFYTEKDIEDLFKGGTMSLEVADNVVLTELAYEKAKSVGMRLLRGQPENPPCAPVRPYISMPQNSSAFARDEGATPGLPRRMDADSPSGKADKMSLEDRIRSAVVARLGNQVDANLLDVIIKRVLNSTGVKEPVCCSAESVAQRYAPSSTAAPKG